MTKSVWIDRDVRAGVSNRELEGGKVHPKIIRFSIYMSIYLRFIPILDAFIVFLQIQLSCLSTEDKQHFDG